MRSLDLDSLRSVCLDAIISRSEPQEYLDAVHACIELPLLVLDSSINAIAYAFELPFYSPGWELAARRAVTSQTAFENRFFYWQDQCSKEVLMAYSTIDNRDPAVIGPVICNDQVVATCGIMVQDADLNDVMEACQLYSKTLSVLMGFTRQYESTFLKNKSVEELLLGGVQTLTAARYFPEYVYAVYRTESSGIARLQYIQMLLAQVESSFISCLDGENSLCILFYNIDDSRLAHICEYLQHICEEYSLCCGISDIFSSGDDISLYRAQALLTFSVQESRRANKLLRFSDCYVDIIIKTSLEYFGDNCTVFPDITRLAAIDQDNGSCYIQSLDAYSSNSFGALKTSEVLGIHKNTLLTRLRKIEEITSHKIQTAPYSFNLEVGLDIYKYIGCHAYQKEREEE